MNKKGKIRNLLKLRSITMTMFWLSLGTITVVLVIGFLIIGVIAPRVYSNSIMNEVEKNLIATLDYYDITLEDIKENPKVEIDVSEIAPLLNPQDNSIIQRFIPPGELTHDNNHYVQTININYLISALAMSRGAFIEIKDMDDNIVYETPEWFKNNVKGVRIHDNKIKYSNRSVLLKDFIEDNAWVTRSTMISLEEDYVLNVRFDLRAFNQNLFIFNRMFIYMIMVGWIFAIVFSLILSYIVTKPLKELKRIATSMENMNFTIRYSKKRDDEIGQLGKTLNHMMDRLGTNINQLEAELQKEKRTDKLRKEFVAQVSHELKTPVAIVSNYTEALLDGVADAKEEQDSYLHTIENECHKMAHIINDLLDLSQMEAGTFKINKSKFELTDLLEDLVNKYENLVKDKFELITNSEIKSAVMYGDELRIEQAVSNLLSNAIKHTKEDGYIKLSAFKENHMVHIQVENQGPPIETELLLHIWDSFTKGADEKGAGLGLSITKNIVEVHNGEYYVQNLDDSVIFGIRLPLV